MKRNEENKHRLDNTNREIIKSKLNFKNHRDITNYEERQQQIIPNVEEKVDECLYFEKIKDNLTKKEIIYQKLKNCKPEELENDETLMSIKESSLIDFDYKRIEEKIKNKTNMIQFKQEKSINTFDKDSSVNNELTNQNNLFDFNQSRPKVLVKQSYDKLLTESEKAALESIVEEETDYKMKIELLKKKKNLVREERLERIKKMKIENSFSSS
jgi:hypothetical protein